MKNKLGLVLEGGGVKGAYQVGAIKAIEELGIHFDGIVGTSIGALNGAIILQGGYQLLSDVWDEVTTCTVFDIEDEMIARFRKKDFDLDMLFYAGKKLTSLREVIRSSYELSSNFLKVHADEKAIRNSQMDFGFVTYNMTDMKPMEAMKEDVEEGKLVDFVIASATFPIFPAKIIDGKKYIDGGVFDNMPINLLAKNGYDKMLIIRTNTASKHPKRKVERGDLELFYVAPKKDLGLAMSFTEDKVLSLRELGYNDCREALENGLKEFLQNTVPAPKSDKQIDGNSNDAESKSKRIAKLEELEVKLKKAIRFTKNEDKVIESRAKVKSTVETGAIAKSTAESGAKAKNTEVSGTKVKSTVDMGAKAKSVVVSGANVDSADSAKVAHSLDNKQEVKNKTKPKHNQNKN